MSVSIQSVTTRLVATRSATFGLVLILAAVGCGGGPAPDAPTANTAPIETSAAADIGTEPAQPEMVARALTPFTGDYDAMLERRFVRVLVPYSRTLYFVDENGRERGISHDLMVEFEKTLNEQLGDKARPVQIITVPVRRDQLFPYLRDGRGDLAIGNITNTPERQALADFSSPVLTGVNEVVVTAASEAPVATARDLSGREVYVRKSSSYYTHLTKLNEELKGEGKDPVAINTVDESLEDEDILEMVNAGAFPITIVDDHLASLWTQVFTEAKIQPGAVVNSGGEIAWAIRKNCPKLTELVNGFIASHAKGTAFGNMVLAKYFGNAKWIKNSTSEAELAKLRATVDLFKKYGKQYDFDWLMIAAQAYQESGIDQSVHSPVGAVGVMQVLPSTAAGNPINITDIESNMENNIHAGVKYMRFMMDEYFKDAQMDDVNKCLFAFASYNGGPAKIARLRKEAEERGLDPNKWFQNVELIAAQRIGRETVTYVKNIYKYYVAYKLVMERREQLEKIKKEAKG